MRLATLPPVTTEVAKIGILRPATLTLVIAEDMTVELDLVQNRPATINITIGEHELMMKGKVDMGLIPYTITPITKVFMIYC